MPTGFCALLKLSLVFFAPPTRVPVFFFEGVLSPDAVMLPIPVDPPMPAVVPFALERRDVWPIFDWVDKVVVPFAGFVEIVPNPLRPPRVNGPIFPL